MYNTHGAESLCLLDLYKVQLNHQRGFSASQSSAVMCVLFMQCCETHACLMLPSH